MKHLSRRVIIAAVILLPAVIFVMAFFNGRYEAIDLPSVETAEADIQPTEAKEETVYVTGGSVNFRKGGSTESEVIATLPAGTELKRVETGETWSRVIYQGQEGYVGNQYLSEENPKN